MADRIPPDAIAGNLMRLAGLDKHTARQCEQIVRGMLAPPTQQRCTEGDCSHAWGPVSPTCPCARIKEETRNG